MSQGDVDSEHFIVMCLDTKNQPTCIQTVHIDSSMIVAHNHPSNVCDPSSEDTSVTKRLKKACEINSSHLNKDLTNHLLLLLPTE